MSSSEVTFESILSDMLGVICHACLIWIQPRFSSGPFELRESRKASFTPKAWTCPWVSRDRT
jgi:hypothetical protein